MPSDYITLNALSAELNTLLAGGKIRRICQPEKDEITLSVYNGRTNLLLVISANPNSPRIHLTTLKKENPYAAPPLLMILRKYIGSAVIKKVSAIAEDRIVEIALSARNEMFDDEDFYLVCELMGRYSNIILLNSERRVLDALYKLIPDEKQKRQIMVGARYLPPEQNKIFIGDSASLEKALAEKSSEEYKDFLVKEVGGVSAPSAIAILDIAKQTDQFTPEGIAKIASDFAEIYDTPYFAPCVCTEGKKDFFPYHYPLSPVRTVGNLDECADLIFSEADRESRVKSRAKSLEHALRLTLRKTENAITAIEKKLAEGEKAEEIRILAELITSNLYQVKPHEHFLNVYDYYTNENRRIELDPTMPANVYAQKLYKRYQKLKRGKEMSEDLLRRNQDNLLYYQAIAAQLKLAENADDLMVTEEEMREAGLLKSPRRVQKNEKSLPYSEYSFQGYRIYCGKGGLQNDFVTFKLGKDRDIWFHAAKSHGAHVIVVADKGEQINDEVIAYAAEIAAYFSERREDLSVTVDYTERKNVRRHPAKKAGLVYYSDYKSISVRPNAHPDTKKGTIKPR